MKAGEEWARRIVEQELERTVVVNDDGSEPGMYDLRIGSADAPEVAIECVGALNPTFTETWNVGPARGPLELSITGDWIMTIAPEARIKAVKKNVEQILRRFEEQEIHQVRVDFRLERLDKALFDELKALNITDASCYRVKGTGKVHLGMPGIGGAVDTYGSTVSEWLGQFLRDSARQDVLRKLQKSKALERHAFVIVEFAGAPWLVESYLSGELDHLPSEAPELPPPVTGAWVVYSLGRRGLRWDGTAWHLFDARGKGIDN